jgi:hypothetical protein
MYPELSVAGCMAPSDNAMSQVMVGLPLRQYTSSYTARVKDQ